jgi:hypothetical protein
MSLCADPRCGAEFHEPKRKGQAGRIPKYCPGCRSMKMRTQRYIEKKAKAALSEEVREALIRFATK